MTIDDLLADIRYNIQDTGGSPKYATASVIVPAAVHVLWDMWKRVRMAFYESSITTSSPTMPSASDDDLPISEDYGDMLINGTSARILRYNSSDPATMRAALKFTELYEAMVPKQ